MNTRLRSGSMGRPREPSLDVDALVNAAEEDADLDLDDDDTGQTAAHLVAGLKDEDNTTSETDAVPMRRSARQATRRASAPKPIPAPPKLASSQEGTGLMSSLMNAAASTSGGLSHTPPTAGTSYEAQHFGKRPRSGSVSGRLRSASDLEDKGIIDRSQKAILKDLIISGDEELQSALDKYEKGDTATLENMIRSGALQNRGVTDIDLLGDLDLDFLTVDDHFGDLGGIGGGEAPLQAPPVLPTQQHFDHHMATAAHANASPTMVSRSPHEDDGIGDLDFGEFTTVTKHAPAPSFEVDTRFRSNSLAYGPLLHDQGTGDQVQYGRWMDRDVPREGRLGSVSSSTEVFAAPVDAPTNVGGLAESLAQYSKSNSKLTKTQLVEQKRREKQEKKEQRERERAEKKERREKEMREKKERDARLKQERKEKKAAQKAKQKEKKVEEEEEEPKERPSGLGIPRSMSDPNLTTSIDENGLLNVERPDGWIGAYSPESRKIRIERFMAKRNHRVWTKKVKYDVRKNFADSRFRVKGRFVKKEDELLMRDLMSLT